MKTRYFATSLIATVLLAGSVRAQLPFVRAQGEIVMPAGGGSLDPTFGFNLSAGYVLGEGKHHELSLSFGTQFWVESETSGHYHYSNPNASTIWIDGQPIEIPANNGKINVADGKLQLQNGVTYHTDYHPALGIIPLMANYRCYLGNKDGRVRIYLGGGAGYALVSAYSDLWDDGDHWYDNDQSDSVWSFAWSGTAGVTIKLTQSLKLDFCYAYQEVDGGTLDMPNVRYRFDAIKTSILRGGVSWQF
jgi:opacity protein-like surface antigen